ncbi:hypothetical protein ACERK3_17155 [Phycisphaerales bacterium AB-hyl4]|uniref:Uncharacterized protein n=1 Tax=Natronomicrosphaera hydrolytica TaxID=3242702 RepID=A0ABV4UA87_9BACT
MSETRRLTAEQRELESALSGLQPRTPRRDPAVLMFELGRRAERRRCRRWQAGVGGLSLLVVLSVSLHVTSFVRPTTGTGVMAEQDEGASPQLVQDEPAERLPQPQQHASTRSERGMAEPVTDRTWSWRTAVSEDAQERSTEHDHSVGHLSRVVQEHGIDALPEPALRFKVDPLNLSSSL